MERSGINETDTAAVDGASEVGSDGGYTVGDALHGGRRRSGVNGSLVVDGYLFAHCPCYVEHLLPAFHASGNGFGLRVFALGRKGGGEMDYVFSGLLLDFRLLGRGAGGKHAQGRHGN